MIGGTTVVTGYTGYAVSETQGDLMEIPDDDYTSWVERTTCPTCAAAPGADCQRRDGKRFHATRMDKGNGERLKRRIRVLRELADIVG